MAASFTAGISASGQITIANGGVGGSSSTDVIIDIAGYIY